MFQLKIAKFLKFHSQFVVFVVVSADLSATLYDTLGVNSAMILRNGKECDGQGRIGQKMGEGGKVLFLFVGQLIITGDGQLAGQIYCCAGEYNINHLQVKMREARKAWTTQEDQALRSFVKKYGIKRWDTISDQMKERFLNEGGRTPNQCKERWMNCLCPKISKDNWTRDQLKYVFDLHMENGNKWSEISERLKADFSKVRTDCAIKNQFYSALRRGLRRICKVLQIKNGTERINKIRPNTLTTLLLGSANLEKEQIYQLIFDCSDNDKFEDIRKKISEPAFRWVIDEILIKVFGKEQYLKLICGESDASISGAHSMNEESSQQAITILPGKALETSFDLQEEMVEIEQKSSEEQKNLVEKIEDEESINKFLFNSKNLNGFLFQSGNSSSGNAKILFEDSWKYQKFCDPEMYQKFRNLSTSIVSSKTGSQNEPLVNEMQKLDIV